MLVGGDDGVGQDPQLGPALGGKRVGGSEAE
jgi:hypothetical protein